MKRFFLVIISAILGFSLLSAPVVEATSVPSAFGVEATILTDCASKENNRGESILCIITLVKDILTIGVGILGVIGITIVGIQYLTAGGSEEKTRKAKQRMIEIVIGLVIYVLLYAIVSWLMPTFEEKGAIIPNRRIIDSIGQVQVVSE